MQGRLFIPAFGVARVVWFLVDTGADFTSLHPRDSDALAIKFGSLGDPIQLAGIGGAQTYYLADSILTFDEGVRLRNYRLSLRIALPGQHNRLLPSLLGRDLLQHWRMVYDPTGQRLEFTVRRSDSTLQV